jgi:hypothetical protein
VNANAQKTEVGKEKINYTGIAVIGKRLIKKMVLLNRKPFLIYLGGENYNKEQECPANYFY